MLYNTGTIAINGNTATGTGTNWTAAASQVRAGQTIIVMSNPVQMFQISSVNSATSMTVTRTSVGEYLIEGCTGLNADAAWGGIDGGFEIPTDRNKQPLLWLDYEVNADGSVLVKTFHRTHSQAPEFAQNLIDGFADGDQIDIPADQFISVRVEMPADSLFNKKMRAAEIALVNKGDE